MAKLTIEIDDKVIDSFCLKNSYSPNTNVLGHHVVSNLTKLQFVSGYLRNYLINEAVNFDLTNRLDSVKLEIESKPEYNKTPVNGDIVSDSDPVIINP